ncbi:hypothetical protein [Candidatus Magnetaquicoccus inordinatus]|nr:hypothetical protein [Candidatus Magnetaquicoccus inordinatus]
MKQTVGRVFMCAVVMLLLTNTAAAADAPIKVDCKSDKKCEELQKAATKK